MNPAFINSFISNNFDFFSINSFVVFVVLSISIYQLFVIRYDYGSLLTLQNRAEPFHIQHEEKLIISDVRYFYMKNGRGIGSTDYLPYPVSAAFGVAGPAIALFGVKLFGLNNFGLRFFYAIIAGLTNMLCVLSIMIISPGLVGVLFSMMFLLNYNSFVLNHYAIIENILTFLLSLLFFLYVSYPAFFIEHILLIGFISGVSILFKPNFVIYSSLFLLSIAFIEQISSFSVFKLSLITIGGVISFEGLQMIILNKMGMVRWRYFNLLRALKQHSGKDVKVLQHFQADGIRIFAKFLDMFAEWYGMGSNLRGFIFDRGKIMIGVLALFISLSYFLPDIYYSFPKASFIIFIFVFSCLVFSFPFYFSFKRAVSFLPFMLMFFSAFINIFIEKMFPAYMESSYLTPICFALLITFYLICQFKDIVNLKIIKSNGVKKNSELLDNDLPKSSIIYAHCYAYRFFWQVKNHRLLSADDQIMSNQMIIDLALKDGGKYLLLSERGGDVTFRGIEPSTILRFIKSYKSINADSGIEDEYILFAIDRDVNVADFDICNINNTDNKRIYYLILQLNCMVHFWGNFKKLGFSLSMLNIDYLVLNVLVKNRSRFSNFTAKILTDVSGFINSNKTLIFQLNDFGEELLFAILASEKLLDKGADMVLNEGYRLKNPEWYPIIADYYANSDVDKAAKLYLKYIENIEAEIGSDLSWGKYESMMNKFYKYSSELKANGYFDLAKSNFLIIEKYNFRISGVYFHLGEIGLNQGNKFEAKQYFKKCVKHNPNNVKARGYLSRRVQLHKCVVG